MKLTAVITFNNNPTPDNYEHLKYLAEKELNRTEYLTVEVVSKRTDDPCDEC